MAYQPIENYGVIGDMHTVALVGMNGSIDWFCYPHFNSPAVFAAILDDRIGGHFRIAPLNENVKSKQLYWPDSNVLVTRFLSPQGVAEIIDYLPVGHAAQRFGRHQLVRRVNVVHGEMGFRAECFPAFNFARDQHTVQINAEGACFHSPSLSLGLATRIPLRQEGLGAAAEFTLQEGQTETFALKQIEPEQSCGWLPSEDECHEQFKLTVEYWHHWLSKCNYEGRWREMVQRSALALKLLTFEPTGAIVAAPTSSLPERIGGARNWDYRYTWIRDAAFTLYALLRIGFTDEARNFMHWLEATMRDPNPDAPLQIMYGIYGDRALTEETLDNLSGYRDSRPVRVGNGAYNQLQLDIYGELMDSIYLYNKYVMPISYDMWTRLRGLVNWVCDNWQRKDEGIWEVRGGQQHFVYSKLMCWVAVDRGLRLADKRSFPANRERWLKVRDEIYEEIFRLGWSEQQQAFVQYYGSDSLDAANLLMPLMLFVSPTDPRMIKTLKAIYRSPDKGGLVSNSLVYRYNLKEYADGIEGDEGTFNICTFWLVEAMTRAGREDKRWLEEARLVFEKALGFANHLGLYAEQTGYSGEALGNFPQAFTHLALISAAYNLDRALGRKD